MSILDFPIPRLRPLHVDEAITNARLGLEAHTRLSSSIAMLCKLTDQAEAAQINADFGAIRGFFSHILKDLEGARK